MAVTYSYEDAANKIRAALNPLLNSMPIQWDNATIDTPDNEPWVRCFTGFTDGQLIQVGNDNTYRRNGALTVYVHTQLGTGPGVALTIIDSVVRSLSDTNNDGIRYHQPTILAGYQEAGEWITGVSISYDFEEVVRLSAGLSGSVADIEDVRSVLRQLADTVLTVPCQFDNTLLDAPEDSIWSRFTILPMTRTRIYPDRYRVQSVADVSIFAPLGEGDGEVLEIADQVVRGFLPATHSGVTLRAPYVTTIGRSGGWWQTNVSCPFYAEI